MLVCGPPMAEVVVVAILDVRPGFEDEALALASRLVPLTQVEEGCSFYSLHRTSDGLILSFVERWESEQSLKSHMRSDHALSFSNQLERVFASVTIHKLNPVIVGDPVKGRLGAPA